MHMLRHILRKLASAYYFQLFEFMYRLFWFSLLQFKLIMQVKHFSEHKTCKHFIKGHKICRTTKLTELICLGLRYSCFLLLFLYPAKLWNSAKYSLFTRKMNDKNYNYLSNLFLDKLGRQSREGAGPKSKAWPDSRSDTYRMH